LDAIADHVIVCLPPGTAGGDWLAYAYVNYWLSVFNDYWCKSPSVQMHEMGTFIRAIFVCSNNVVLSISPDFGHDVTGHNLNLGHAGEGFEEYGDQSGMMVSRFDVFVCWNSIVYIMFLINPNNDVRFS
jgi:hypothetical protein